MKRVLCLRFCNWPVQRLQRLQSTDSQGGLVSRLAIYTAAPQAGAAAARSDSEQRDTAFVRDIFPSSRSGATILCSSQAAWHQGVRPGLPLGEARSMAAPVAKPSAAGRQPADTHFVPWDPVGDRRTLMELAEHARMFAPLIGLENGPVPDSLIMDITGCGVLFQGETVLAERLLKTFQQSGWQCRVAISDSAAAAWAFAHPGGHLLTQSTGPGEIDPRFDQSWQADSIIIPPGQSAGYLGSFPVAAGRIPLTDVRTLAELGIHTLRQLLDLPVEDLPSRLGNTTIERIRQLAGVDEELIRSIPEASPITASWVSETGATSRSEIRQVLDHLTQELEPQLRHRGLGAIALQAVMKHEDGSTDTLSAQVVSPLQDAARLLEVLHLRIESLHVKRPVFSIRMTTTVAPLPVARQKDLFSASEHLEPQEELTAVINRLNGRLGNNAVLTAAVSDSSVPEDTIQLTPVMSETAVTSRRTAACRIEQLVQTEADAADKAFAVRPVFLLPVPVRVPSLKPAARTFVWEGRTFEMQEWIGPERVQTHWWQEISVHRDYYRLLTTQGPEFWAFQNLTDGTWFLHGIFE
ncbi:MAG: DNA polymerase Y family protein [Planctomycetaceae bacterium]|nr:DNA polymerase Y family protein [Planctomycetaceae bacterium]